jgi:WD40 repeat protein
VKWWDLESGRVINSLEAHSSSVYSVAFSPDGKTALSGSLDDTVKWWDLESGRVINSLEAHSSRVYSVAFSPDGKTALSGSDDHTTRLWNLSTGEEIIRLVGFKDGEGVAIMPQQGYYVASPKGEKYINVSFGNRAVGIEGYEKYKKFYHRPDILKLAWQLGNAERAIALANKKRR